MSELPLDDGEGDALAEHVAGALVSELVWVYALVDFCFSGVESEVGGEVPDVETCGVVRAEEGDVWLSWSAFFDPGLQGVEGGSVDCDHAGFLSFSAQDVDGAAVEVDVLECEGGGFGDAEP